MKMKTRQKRYHGNFTVGQAAAFSFAPVDIIIHLFKAGRIPGAYLDDAGQPVIPIPGMKEAMSKSHTTLTLKNRALTQRLFHGVTPHDDLTKVEVFSTTAGVEEYIRMFSANNEGPTKVVHE